MLSFKEYIIKENINEGVILYHATNSTWRIPEIKYLGFHAGTLKAAMDRLKSFQMKINPHIIKLKFHLKNALYIGRDYRFHDNLTKVSTELYKDGIISKGEMNDFIRIYSEDATFKNLRNLLHDKYGYDGIIYRNNIEDRGSESYIAFYPEQIEILDYDFNPNIQESIKNSVITLYHGVKHGDKFTKFDFENIFPYFYLTPEYSYSLEYAKGELSNVLEFQIDTKNIIDLTSFGVQDLIFSDFQKMFYKKTKIYFPTDLKDLFPTSFWEIVRKDRLGHLSKRLKSNGIDGFKMLETFYHISDWKNPSKDATRVHESYVLLNNSPIII